MELNVLTASVGERARDPVAVDKRGFWRTYLSIIRANGVNLTGKEIEMMSYILSGTPRKDFFRVPFSSMLKRAIPNVSKSELSRMKQRLIDKELMLVRPNGQTLPAPQLIALQEQLIKRPGQVFSFIFPLQVHDDKTAS